MLFLLLLNCLSHGAAKLDMMHYYISGLEKSSVLPVLNRFLSLNTNFDLNRKRKNRSIKVRFFPSNS